MISVQNKYVVQELSLNGKMSARNLPVAQIKTFQATDVLVRILASMCKRKYLNSENVELIKKDIDSTTKDIKNSKVQSIIKNVA